jgi:hypothetical protein
LRGIIIQNARRQRRLRRCQLNRLRRCVCHTWSLRTRSSISLFLLRNCQRIRGISGFLASGHDSIVCWLKQIKRGSPKTWERLCPKFAPLLSKSLFRNGAAPAPLFPLRQYIVPLPPKTSVVPAARRPRSRE